MYYAFFDVDETLIRGKSMFLFAEYCSRELGDDDTIDRCARVKQLLLPHTQRSVDRSRLNLSYYEILLRGWPIELVAQLGYSWFREQLASQDFLLQKTVDIAQRHADHGGRIALVSGSFPALLNPLANYLTAEDLICTELEEIDGRYTGRVLNPCIGTEKARRILSLLDRANIPPGKCFAYGDHCSDAQMLLAVGSAGIVGSDPVLLELAHVHGWTHVEAPENAARENTSVSTL